MIAAGRGTVDAKRDGFLTSMATDAYATCSYL